ncbi:MAG: patatin-like phospholipase family protein [Thiolinea sp.]
MSSLNTSTSGKIGLALGSGAARGWAHIGAIKQLQAMGIHPDIVTGCSIGAIVGAAYVVDNLDKLEKAVLGLNKLEMMKYFEFNLSLNGFVRQEKLRQFFHDHVCARQQSMEGLKKPLATVATDLYTGREIWFTQGPVMEAVWASIALPGLFPPVRHEERWLVDGGLVNPVPVSLCRALGAETVIAINLNNRRRKPIQQPVPETAAPVPVVHDEKPVEADIPAERNLVSNVTASLLEYSSTLFQTAKNDSAAPSLLDAMTGSINIMQDKITRSRMAGDPPEILLNARVGDIGLMEFYRAAEAIEEGRQCVLRMQAEIEHIMTSHP